MRKACTPLVLLLLSAILLAAALAAPKQLRGKVGAKVSRRSSAFDATTKAAGSVASHRRSSSSVVATPQDESLRLEREQVKSMRRLTANAGWVLAQNRLLWTNDAGIEWDDITPVGTAGQTIFGAFFLDASRGWAVLKPALDLIEEPSSSLEMATTIDGGKTWSSEQRLVIATEDDADVERAVVDFVDAQHGWVMARLASGSNFSRGVLFATTDGGNSWRKLPAPPIGDPVRFITATDGWLAGGPGGNELYVTRNGGSSWTPQAVAPPSNAYEASQAVYDLPTFQNSESGTLPVTFTNAETSAIAFYNTRDGGETWQPATIVPLATQVGSGAKVISSIVDSTFLVAAPSAQSKTVTLERRGKKNAFKIVGNLPPEASVINADFASATQGWLLITVGHCARFKEQCVQETKLLSTNNGGQTTRDITPYTNATPQSQPGGALRISNKYGFDKCTAATVGNMQTWWNSSPYRDANIYIGGNSRGCSQANLNATWIDQVSAMGWGLIPTWVGPQASCSTYTNRISADTATAQSQGISEADNATNVAAALGLTQGTIIYYDLENYNSTNAACRASTSAFVNGWVQQMHARGNKAGVYGSATNAAGDWVSIANPPDAIWIGKWDLRETVFGLTPLSDTLWPNHQRIHQYRGGHDETWGGLTFNIDNDIADGPVAGADADVAPTPTRPRLPVRPPNCQTTPCRP